VLPEVVHQVELKLLDLTERWTKGRFWVWRVVAITTAVSLFLAFPSYDSLRGEEPGRTWKAVMIKADDLTRDLLKDFGPATNPAKVNFRLLMPIVARVTGLGIPGLLALQGLAGVLLFYLITLLAYRATSSRPTAALVTLMTGATYSGITSFVELRGLFDGISICLLLACLYISNPRLIALLIFAAGWNDERALLAVPLLVVGRLVERQGGQASWWRPFLQGPLLGLYVGCLLHVVSRWYYSTHFGIALPFGGTGPRVLLDQINMIPMGVWTALEGGWLLVPACVLVLYREGRRLIAFLFIAAVAGLLVTALSVVDVSRSTAYCLPAVVVCLSVLGRSERSQGLWRLCCIACCVSLLWPAYYAGGKASIRWQYPLPLQVVRWALLSK
jgi:hypothetical protein